MTTLTSGLHFLSGLALHFGALPARSIAQPMKTPSKRHQKARGDGAYTPLSERQKKELLESIRHDDWFE